MAACKISRCRRCKSARSSGFSRHLISGLCAKVPVPEQGTSTRTRSKLDTRGELPHVRVDHFNILCRNQFAQQARAVRMQLQGNDAGLGILFRQHAGFAARRRATIQNLRSPACQQSDQLRGFILNCNSSLGKGTGCADISPLEPAEPTPTAGRERVRFRFASVLPLPRDRRYESRSRERAGRSSKFAAQRQDRTRAPSARPATAGAPSFWESSAAGWTESGEDLAS